ncbi:MAG: hypothetical protein ABJA98_16490 [Acidobacteriota bacterium]
MSKQSMMGLALTAILACAVPGTIAAHEGHTHKVMGTVASVQGKTVEVKTTAGKSVKVTCDDKTTVTRGKESLDISALKIGERVSIDAMQEKDLMMAHAIKLAAPAPAKK